ncbi:MAG: TVP38/TMEM64 family protein [Acetivibrionales bacterium]|jgi:uncharacterized membrane protein YdjX (TVP38/TMEM64 family)
MLASYGFSGVPVFIFFQFAQVIVAAIPGEVVQIAGGYIYGTFYGTLFSIVGILAGYITAFLLSRLMGYPIVKAFVAEKHIKKFQFLMNSRKSEIALFVLFLIPGLPKDVLVYIAGLTPVRPIRFLTLAMSARLPALVGSSFIGANLQKRNYAIAAIVSIIAVVLFVLGVFLRDRITDIIKRLLINSEKNKA